MLYYIDKNWYHFVKEYLEQFSKFAFQEVARLVGQPNRHILEILLARRHTLVAQNRRAGVRLHHGIYQSNTYRKYFSWLHFSDEASVQERQQVKDHHSCISVSVAYPTISSSN